jgi:Zn finger protein HypA/HybF involved in hydrogenase expression
VKVVAYIIAAIIGLLGIVFLAGSQGQIIRLVVGAVLLIAAIAIAYLARVQPKPGQTTTVQKIDLSGDVDIQEIRCRSCNAPLSKDEIDVKAGAIFVQCDHCGATYQFEEEPKW